LNIYSNESKPGKKRLGMNIDIDKLIVNGCEWEVFLTIDGYEFHIWKMHHEMNKGNIPSEEWPLIEKELETYTAYLAKLHGCLNRFGVDISGSSEDRKKWIYFWRSWKEGMKQERWDEFRRSLNGRKPIGEFLPVEDWKGRKINFGENIKSILNAISYELEDADDLLLSDCHQGKSLRKHKEFFIALNHELTAAANEMPHNQVHATRRKLSELRKIMEDAEKAVEKHYPSWTDPEEVDECR